MALIKDTANKLVTVHADLVRVVHRVISDKKQVHVTELPVGLWTEDFKKHLETLIESGTIKEYSDMSTDTIVDFTVTFPANADLDSAAYSAIVDYGCCTALEKLLKTGSDTRTQNTRSRARPVRRWIMRRVSWPILPILM